MQTAFSVAAFIFALLKALNEGSILKKKQNQRKREAMILLPTLYFWLFSIFPVNLFNMLGLSMFGGLLQMWQLNLFVITICIIGVIFSAIKGEGFLGIKIITTRYSHDLKMPVNDFMSNLTHRIKSDTSYMGVKTDKIKDALASGRDIGDIRGETGIPTQSIWKKNPLNWRTCWTKPKGLK